MAFMGFVILRLSWVLWSCGFHGFCGLRFGGVLWSYGFHGFCGLRFLGVLWSYGFHGFFGLTVFMGFVVLRFLLSWFNTLMLLRSPGF